MNKKKIAILHTSTKLNSNKTEDYPGVMGDGW